LDVGKKSVNNFRFDTNPCKTTDFTCVHIDTYINTTANFLLVDIRKDATFKGDDTMVILRF